ncbi:hypothetical protein EST38_g5960 [Candolleomyces aberdarensis]|uniref:non-specific serine/threonine protein kinase n=1 Tax=Candolleomyces aberdarensis TaxID=2316362 RepID=A0A4Q2DLW2_9AGAR|nr:hypothetical protein EST38_g5960 [Candolleomyces aberdarensis]
MTTKKRKARSRLVQVFHPSPAPNPRAVENRHPANRAPAPLPPPSASEEIKDPEEDEKSIEEKLAERRRKRAEILAKHVSGQSSTAVGGVNGAGTIPRATPGTMVSEALAKVTMMDNDGKSQLPGLQTPTATAPPSKVVTATPSIAPQSRRESASPPPPPSATTEFDLAKLEGKEDGVDAKEGDAGEEGVEGGGVGAADYDPSLDRREDEKRRFGIEAPAPPGEGATIEKKDQNAMVVDGDDDDVEEVEVTDDEGEEEEEEVDDMFAIGDDDEEKEKKKEKVKKKAKKRQPAPLISHHSLLVDSAADAEGYYTIILGEYLDNGRYQVFSSLGKGMFANVVRARVLKEEDPTSGELVDVSGGESAGGMEGKGLREVAIKIVRCQDPMYKAGLKEAQILQKLRAMDQEDKKHVVKLERTFEHRGHLCLVFESLSMNLREVVKRFGKDVGINIKAVRAYAHQLFLALSLLKKANVMHADIKPDNILVNEQKTLLKLCDLGSASDASENEVTPYLVSRFYRAPEIILGVPYDPSLDIWSIGCTLYELYTGKILFPGRSNSHMLLLMMEVKGRFNSKMIKRAKFGDKYFDSLGNLLPSALDDGTTFTDESAATRSARLSSGKPVRDLKTKILGGASVKKMKEEEVRVLTTFVDLLEKCLILDPGRRITPREALVHPFIRG